MSLADINEELHRRSREAESNEDGTPAVILPKSSLPDPVSTAPAEVPLGAAWGGEAKQETPSGTPGLELRNPFLRLPRKVALILGGIALAAIAGGVIFKAGGWLFSAENVQIVITGPKRAESNEILEYVIRYENNNWVDLEDAELIITYPEFFRFSPDNGFQVSATRAVLPLGSVEKSSLNSIIIKGSFRSLQDQVALFTVTLRAAPKGVASRVDTEYRYSTAVESSAIVVELSAPAQAGDGQFADYVATYRNESTETIDNLELVIEYPAGFSFREATPTPSREENIWTIRSLAPGESATVTARGLIAGVQGDVKRALAKVGVPQGDGTLLSYAEIERQTRIVASPLVIFQKIGVGEEKKSVAPGEALAYRLIFRNDGDVGLRDLILTVDLDPKYFDVSRINVGEGGTYNIPKKQVIFRAADRSALSLIEPGRGGEISFSVPVRSDLAKYGQSNIEIESIARIDSPDVPTPIGANKIVGSNRLTFKVRTLPVLELSGYHYDGYGNSGPIPPIVGQETTYTLVLRIASTLNAVQDARVVLSVPGQVRYLKTLASGQGAFVYNDRTGEIFWNIGTLAPGTGGMIEATIQIGFTPDPSQVDDNKARLVNSTTFTGKDIWSGEEIRQVLPPKLLGLSEDARLTSLHGDKIQAAP